MKPLQFDLEVTDRSRTLFSFSSCSLSIHVDGVSRTGAHVHVPNPDAEGLERSDAPHHVADGRHQRRPRLRCHIFHFLSLVRHSGKIQKARKWIYVFAYHVVGEEFGGSL